MTDRARLLEFLTQINAFAQAHSDETLGDHLMNCFDILDATDCDWEVCLAGGLHSVYGTCHFRHVSEHKREAIRTIFGERVESLAYLFSSLNRPAGLENLDKLYDWKTRKKVNLSDEDIYALRLIEAANLIEQGVDLSKYPTIAATLDARIESLEGESS